LLLDCFLLSEGASALAGSQERPAEGIHGAWKTSGLNTMAVLPNQQKRLRFLLFVGRNRRLVLQTEYRGICTFLFLFK
jgi:hypothetical protein